MSFPQRHGSLTRQFAWAAAVLASVAVLFIAAGSWWWIDRLQRDAGMALSQKDAALRAAQVSATLVSIEERLAEIAGGPLLATALTDSLGREAYLLPYLGSVQNVNGIPVELLLVDFEGQEIGRNGDLSFTPAQRDWLRAQLQMGRPGTSVSRDPGGEVLLAAEMIRYARTNTVEGALLLKLSTTRLLADPRYRLVRVEKVEPAAPGEVRAAVALPPVFGDLRFEVVGAVGGMSDPWVSVHPASFVAAAVALIVSVVLVGMRLADRLTSELRGLERFTREVAQRSFGADRASITGPDEVAGLAASVNLMLDRLNEQHAAMQSESEAQLRLLSTCISRLNDVVMITEAQATGGKDRAILFVNDAFVRLAGYSRDEVIGRSRSMLQGPLTDRAELARIRTALDSLQPVRAELLNYTKSGQTYWSEIDIVPVSDAKGVVTHWISVERDVSERRAAQATQRQLEAQVRESQKLESIHTLASGIAHDFNNILPAILGNIALARSALEPLHPAQTHLEQIGRSAARARTLVQQILEFSRRRPQQASHQLLRPLVEETVGLLRATVPARVRIEAELPAEPIHVLADESAVQQVLMNLGTNAWHALHGSTGVIRFGLESVQLGSPGDAAAPRPDTPDGLAGLPAGRYAHLWVQDDGSGMDEATRVRIFEPFFTTKPVGSGTGLGLSVVHGIVRAHGGSIGVQSSLGTGSIFHIHLPQVLPTALARAEAAATAPAAGQGQHVLYLDDDEVMVTMAEAMLRRWGYRVTALRDAQQAVDAVRAAPSAFDIVVTDFNMPDLSGLEVLRALSGIRADLPVILTSGYLSDEVREQALAAGASGLLRKEHTHDELAGLLAKALSAVV